MRHSTVEQLIKALQALPASARTLHVDLEGCDCNGPADGVELRLGPNDEPYVRSAALAQAREALQILEEVSARVAARTRERIDECEALAYDEGVQFEVPGGWNKP